MLLLFADVDVSIVQKPDSKGERLKKTMYIMGQCKKNFRRNHQGDGLQIKRACDLCRANWDLASCFAAPPSKVTPLIVFPGRNWRTANTCFTAPRKRSKCGRVIGASQGTFHGPNKWLLGRRIEIEAGFLQRSCN